jgi:hypothetical protein
MSVEWEHKTKAQMIAHGKIVASATAAIEAGMRRAKECGYTKQHDTALAILTELEEVFNLRKKPQKKFEGFRDHYSGRYEPAED